MMCYIKECI